MIGSMDWTLILTVAAVVAGAILVDTLFPAGRHRAPSRLCRPPGRHTVGAPITLRPATETEAEQALLDFMFKGHAVDWDCDTVHAWLYTDPTYPTDGTAVTGEGYTRGNA